MLRAGNYEVCSDRGACLVWNGRRLPGTWLVSRGLDVLLPRARQFGQATLLIAESHHIGALAAYLRRATEQGLILLISCSTASVSVVAPFGGRQRLFTPNPLAAGFPTRQNPIMLDISASITTLNRAQQLAAAGERYPHPWLLTVEGIPTDDPTALAEGGSLLPIGGIDHGHKGYNLALLTEALTQGLSGVGRADHPGGTCTQVMLQAWDPEAFAGLDALTRQTDWLVNACRTNPPRPGVSAVRVPGDRAESHRKQCIEDGVPLSVSTIERLHREIEHIGLTMPSIFSSN